MAPAPDKQGSKRQIAALKAPDGAALPAAAAQDEEYRRQAADFVEYSPDAILRIDGACRIAYANRSATRVFELAESALVGLHLDDLNARSTTGSTFAADVRQVLASHEAAVSALALPRPGGDKHFEVRLVPTGNGAAPAHVFATMRDISTRLAKAEALNQALREQETIFEGTAAGLFVSRDRVIVKVNRQLETMFGYAAGELLGTHSSAFRVSREESDAISAENRARMRAGETVRRQAEFVRKDGSKFWAESINRPLVPGHPEEGVIGVIFDISEQKEQELALQRALAELNTIFDSTGVGLALVQERTFVRCNRQLEEMFGFAPGEMLGKSTRIAYPSQEEFDNLAPLFAAMQQNGEPVAFEQRYVRKDGSEIWLAVTAHLASRDGSAPGMIMVGMDITARKQQEQQLQLALLELQTIFDGTGLGIMVTGGGIIRRCNRQLEAMLGYAPGALLGCSAESLHPGAEAATAAREHSREQLASRPYLTRRDILRRRDGSEVWVEVTNRAIYLAGSVEEQVVSVVVDITEQQQQETKLRQAVLEQQQIFDTTLVGMAIIRDRTIVKGNAAAAKMLGYGVDDLPGLSTRVFFASDADFEAAGKAIYETVDREGAAQTEVPLRHRDGRMRWTSTHASALSPGDPSAGYIFGFLDIEDRIRSESVLRETEALLESVVENLPVMLSVKDAKTMAYIRFNRTAEAISGWQRGAAIGKTVFDLYPRFLAEGYASADRAAISGKKPTPPVQEMLITGGGDTRQILTRSVPILAGDGEVRYLMTIAEDVTEQRAAELALRESEERFRQFADNVDRLFFITNPERTVCHYVNDAHLDLFGMSAEEARRNPRAFLEFVDAAYRNIAEASFLADRQGSGTESEVLINHPRKGRRWIHSRTFPVTLNTGEIRVFGIAEDVTERRMREDARIQEAMQQRDVLVREVHHRIKNNLQGVAGLLEHAAQIKPAVAAELKEVIGQIQAIAQVHGLQVREGGELSLRAMTQAIVDSQRRISATPFEFSNLEEQADAWTIPEHEAVPLALVFNELLSNAVKYCEGDSVVSARLVAEQGGVVWRVRNRGRLQPGFDFATISAGAAGLSLVKALLPRKGSSLRLEQHGSEVLAELALNPPVVRLSTE